MDDKVAINVLGTLEVSYAGDQICLPASRKTRALLGYLAINGSPERRDRLCELLWDVPDDPRGALRWSLSKLRPIVNCGAKTRLLADRERVCLDTGHFTIDLLEAQTLIRDDLARPRSLIDLWPQLDKILLADCEIPNQDGFSLWLAQARGEVERLKALLAERIATSDSLATAEKPLWADRWLENAPMNSKAALQVVAARRRLGRDEEAERLADEIDRLFRSAGLQVCRCRIFPRRYQTCDNSNRRRLRLPSQGRRNRFGLPERRITYR